MKIKAGDKVLIFSVQKAKEILVEVQEVYEIKDSIYAKEEGEVLYTYLVSKGDEYKPMVIPEKDILGKVAYFKERKIKCGKLI